MTRERAIQTLLNEVAELLADYETVALDENGELDVFRKRRIRRIGRLLLFLKTGQGF